MDDCVVALKRYSTVNENGQVAADRHRNTHFEGRRHGVAQLIGAGINRSFAKNVCRRYSMIRRCGERLTS
jgi:hypothetical protein